MTELWQVIIASLAGGLLSLVGGVALLSQKKQTNKLAEYATPFAAGALLAAAFIDLLAEAGERGSYKTGLVWALFGMLIFFVLERSLDWFHHHHEHENQTESKKDQTGASLIVIGDTLHNFIDGIAIAAAFLVDAPTGIVVTLAVAAHEIPQEIGDFGLLLQKGLDRSKVLWVSVASAMATVVAAVMFFTIGQDVSLPLDAILGLVAGMFIYIASSDIIPTIHEVKDRSLATAKTILLLTGVLVVSLATTMLHDVIDQTHDHGDDHSHSTEIETNDHGHEDFDHHDDAEHTHDDEKNNHNETIEYTDHGTLPAVAVSASRDSKSGWNITLDTTNFNFTPKAVGATDVLGEGHAHLYINDVKVARLYAETFHFDGELTSGDVVRVSLNANSHAEYTHDGLPIEAIFIVP